MGSTINVLVAAYFPVPTPYEQNPTWQAVNKQLNADVRMNIIPTADYRTKFATTIASEDLPDIMHRYFGYSVAPNLPQFFKGKCADLTPFLAGDAAKDYPCSVSRPASWRSQHWLYSRGLTGREYFGCVDPRGQFRASRASTAR